MVSRECLRETLAVLLVAGAIVLAAYLLGGSGVEVHWAPPGTPSFSSLETLPLPVGV